MSPAKSLAVIVAATAFFIATFSSRPSSQDPDQSVACDGSAVASGKTYLGPAEETILKSSPTADGQLLTNKQASETLKTTIFISVTGSNTLREECRKGNWSKVRVIDQPGISGTYVGWMPSAGLRTAQIDKDGFRTYEVADFVWDTETSKHKNTIVEGVNQVHRKNPLCKELSTSNIGISRSKSEPGNPVFYVSCGAGNALTNVYFSRSDVLTEFSDTPQGTPFVDKTAEYMPRNQAVNECAQAARSKIERRETFKFSTASEDLKVVTAPGGETRVSSLFMAKGKGGEDFVYEIQCAFNKTEILESSIARSEREMH